VDLLGTLDNQDLRVPEEIQGQMEVQELLDPLVHQDSLVLMEI